MTVPAYVAAPYASPDPLGVLYNVERAKLIGQLIMWGYEGVKYAPIVPHVLVPALTGTEDQGVHVREQALSICLGLLTPLKPLNEARLFVLCSSPVERGQAFDLTEGVRKELNHWLAGPHFPIDRVIFLDWQKVAYLWARLCAKCVDRPYAENPTMFHRAGEAKALADFDVWKEGRYAKASS